MANEINLTTLTDEELNNFHKAWENEAKRRCAIRRRQALINFREALIGFIAEGVHYDCERYIELEVTNNIGEDDVVEIDVFNEEILVSIKDCLDRKVGNYTGE
jgi:hypothetical protein